MYEIQGSALSLISFNRLRLSSFLCWRPILKTALIDIFLKETQLWGDFLASFSSKVLVLQRTTEVEAEKELKQSKCLTVI